MLNNRAKLDRALPEVLTPVPLCAAGYDVRTPRALRVVSIVFYIHAKFRRARESKNINIL